MARHDAMHLYSHGRVGVHPNAWRQGFLFSQPFTIPIFFFKIPQLIWTAENLLQEVSVTGKRLCVDDLELCRRPKVRAIGIVSRSQRLWKHRQRRKTVSIDGSISTLAIGIGTIIGLRV
jgi:hypothetical protein